MSSSPALAAVVSPPRLLVVAMYVLVGDGLLALHLGGLLGPLGLTLVGGAVVGSFWQSRLRAPLTRIRGGSTVPGVLALGASVIDLVYVAPSILDGLIHLLLLLLLYRLYTRESLRDVRDVGFVCFFMLVGAAPGTFDVGFLFVFVTFLVVGTALLLLRHLLDEPARHRRGALALGATRVRGRHIGALTVAGALATLAVTGALFFVIPRIGQAALPLRAKTGRMISGFSERVSLGAFGEIETDASVVMRVHIAEGMPAPERLPGLRWRGIALDRFDGRQWSRDDGDRVSVRRGPDGAFELARPRGGGVLVGQEIYLEPLGTDVIFGAPRALRLTVRAPEVSVDAAGSVAVPLATARLGYAVESELEPPSPRARARAETLDASARARYLQLPPIPPRVAALAARVTDGSVGALEAARRLESYLSQQYSYTLALPRTTDLPPVEEFLFVSRSGNCEYFAASLAVLLRTIGIPARVVNGFQRGEWNPYGRYFMVRLLDAHSWVEAFVDDVGWVTVDASPRGALDAASAPRAVNLYLDALRMRWYRYVVNWSFSDQVHAAGRVRRVARSWTPRLDWLRPHETAGRGLAVAGAALVVAAVLVAGWRRLGRARSAASVPDFYRRALRALARRGFVPAGGETAREFARRVSQTAPALAEPVWVVTGGYERARFGSQPPSTDERVALDRCVVALAARRRRPRLISR